MSIAARILIALGCLLGAFLGGWHARSVKAEAEASRAKDAAAVELRSANVENGKVTDELLKDRASFAAAAASSADRLRKLSSTRSPTATACSRLDEPAATIIPDELRASLVEEAKRANGYALDLTKLQDYVRRVCKPE